MTPAELTALLAPVRAELDAIERQAQDYCESEATSAAQHAVDRVARALDKLTPPAELDPMVVLGIAALGMLRELQTSEYLGRARAGFTSTTTGEDWIERADALLAAAYPKG
jgi:hypothetical protein